MIKTIKENNFFKTFSDSGYYVLKVSTNETFEVAFDLEKTEYIETTTKIPLPKTQEEIEEEERLAREEDEKMEKERQERIAREQKEALEAQKID